MRYRIKHSTEYIYNAKVSHCYNVAHIIPRTSSRQTCLWSEVKVEPLAAISSKQEDYYGNMAFHFEIQQPHTRLMITATSEVETHSQLSKSPLLTQTQSQGPGSQSIQQLVMPFPQEKGLSWLDALKRLAEAHSPEDLLAREYLFDSPMIQATEALRAYAEPSFGNDRPLLAAVKDLTQRIFTDFTYDPQSTTVSTPLAEVLATKRGVCQDFAHLQIGCLRALGIPAKYVSGYIETIPPAGTIKLVGTDASHAWISVYSPLDGWIEFDPTNNCTAGTQHIITAWGRDYFDVTPLRGVIYGGGTGPVMNISVDVARR